MGDQVLMTEIPSCLKQLARYVVRGFYGVEDALILDMLVRHPCELFDESLFSTSIILIIFSLSLYR